jgi:glycine/D-amino acid oxidase-like deaminating enzyme
MISLWEQEVFENYDVIIVGAGITGLSTAASLKEKDPNLSIVILERGLLPTGASTKNAGFACFGSLTELMDDRKVMGDKNMLALVDKRWRGLLKTRSRLGDKAIQFQQKGGYELIFDKKNYTWEMNEINQLLKPIFNKQVFTDTSKLIPKMGFKYVDQLFYNHLEGQLHPGKLIDGLWSYCASLGVKIITGAMVTHVDGNEVIANLKQRYRGKVVVICTNAFTPGLIDQFVENEIRPGRGMVLAIQPGDSLQFEGTFHYNEGYYYFRDHHGLLIYGGGRNLDFENETTTLFEINQKIKRKLVEDLKEYILPGDSFKIIKEWTGIMAFGDTKQPIVKRLDSGHYVGVRLGGMGVAIGSQVGEELAQLVRIDGL